MSDTINTAIIRTEYRQSITFVSVPSVDTCKELRRYGYDLLRVPLACAF